MSLETEMRAAGVALDAARAAYRRSKSAPRARAFADAAARWETAFAAYRAELDAQDRAELRARRLALVAPRRALLARQAAFTF